MTNPQAPLNSKLIELRAEYRTTMDGEVLHDWARDMIRALNEQARLSLKGGSTTSEEDPHLDKALARQLYTKLDRWAGEMDRSAKAMREMGMVDVALGNEALAADLRRTLPYLAHPTGRTRGAVGIPTSLDNAPSTAPSHAAKGGSVSSQPSGAGGDHVADVSNMVAAMREACDLLTERTHGNPARSPGHNARLVLERALSTKQVAP